MSYLTDFSLQKLTVNEITMKSIASRTLQVCIPPKMCEAFYDVITVNINHSLLLFGLHKDDTYLAIFIEDLNLSQMQGHSTKPTRRQPLR